MNKLPVTPSDQRAYTAATNWLSPSGIRLDTNAAPSPVKPRWWQAQQDTYRRWFENKLANALSPVSDEWRANHSFRDGRHS